MHGIRKILGVLAETIAWGAFSSLHLALNIPHIWS